MKALIIIASCFTLALVLRIIDVLTSRKMINSVGSKANRKSKEMARVNINNEEDLKNALELYKDLAD